MIISYDFGTSSVKAALFDAEGNIVASGVRKYPLIFSGPDRVEQDPADWWNAMCSLTSELMSTAGVKSSTITALNLCAQMCGTLPVDIKGNPLTRCLTWLDTRSGEIARRITRGIPGFGGYGLVRLLRWLWITNGAPNLAGRDPVSKILWLREHCPEVWKQTHKILDVKDYLLYRCSGTYTTTPDSAHLTWLMDSRPGKKCWSTNLLSWLDLRQDLFPEICKPTDIIGKLTADAAGELGLPAGIKILAGAGDVTASALGAGTVEVSAPHLYIGTSTWIGAHTSQRKVDVYNNIGAICAADPDKYLLIAAQQSGGLSLDWAGGHFDLMKAGVTDYATINKMAGDSATGPDNPLFLPWLMGECVPKKIPVNSAAFIKLGKSNTKPVLIRAILEGVALNIRWSYRHLNKMMQNRGKEVRFLGGGANSEAWCQILSDILQLPILQMDMPHLGGVRGVAMLASVALGWQNTLKEAAKSAKAKSVFYPDSSKADYYSERFALFLDQYHTNIKQ